MKILKSYPKVLTIAGSDSGGGAGIQADLKTISALGCYGTSAITAVTVQNTLGVSNIHPVPVDIVKEQIEAVLSDIGTDAVKIGMLHSVKIIEAVKNVLKEYKPAFIILDPVMVAASGDKLIEDDTIEVMIKELFPLATVITPNLDEAAIIAGMPVKTQEDMIRAAKKILSYGSRSVLVKGGHLPGNKLFDIFLTNKDSCPLIMENKKIQSHNIHGTGCTLSSAIASLLAKGESLEQAVKKGIVYVHTAIERGKNYKTGNGHGPVNHFFAPKKLK
ncbi:MAG TPA: bifunctional hydroxymethylpyrimidine kinase/phosphomethylpyrimidine kinase [Bacteroidetes bacterium]|nr:bifunctional hydroxymethylpyrimidine kinase/phosphomethylpyrimidine kinase [Bacteroidota bacterium]